jgi:hypothetical protein
MMVGEKSGARAGATGWLKLRLQNIPPKKTKTLRLTPAQSCEVERGLKKIGESIS